MKIATQRIGAGVQVLLPALSCAVLFCSCFLMRSAPPPAPPDPWRTRPKMPMSEDFMRSRGGDIMVFLPKNWFVINTENAMSGDIAGVAVNPPYTASLILHMIRENESVKTRLRREGLGGLARAVFEQRMAKAPSTLKLLKVVDTLEYAGKNFGYYEFTTDTSAVPALIMRSAVCRSSANFLYEISLVPTPVTASNQPTRDELDSLFQSVLVTALF